VADALHHVDYDDELRSWACSCGYTARTLAATRRHASSANATRKSEVDTA
jgi:hypothetical protein